jgi:hypothetical protein
MRTYGSESLARTLRALRACRFFNFFFVAETNIVALRDEMVHLYNIAYFSEKDVMTKLEAELEQYISLAQEAKRVFTLSNAEEDKDLLIFWQRSFWLAACEVAIFHRPLHSSRDYFLTFERVSMIHKKNHLKTIRKRAQ